MSSILTLILHATYGVYVHTVQTYCMRSKQERGGEEEEGEGSESMSESKRQREKKVSRDSQAPINTVYKRKRLDSRGTSSLLSATFEIDRVCSTS